MWKIKIAVLGYENGVELICKYIKLGRRLDVYKQFIITGDTLSQYFNQLNLGGKNPAYVTNAYPDIVYMQYQENGEDLFTILDRQSYMSIKDKEWEGFNGYVVNKKDHTEYLHRAICQGLSEGQIVHHKGHRFDNRSSMLEPVDRKEHDQHRTYYEDLKI